MNLLDFQTHVFVTLVAIFLILLILFDAFVTIVLPRTVAFFRPSMLFYNSAWSLWARAGTRVKDLNRRQTFYSMFGPLSVLMLLLFWGLGLMFSFAMLHWGLKSKIYVTDQSYWNFRTLLYFSGTTFLTLGMGDVTALNPMGRVLIVLEALTGFVSLAVIVGYLPLLEQAFSNRETRLTLFGLRCGAPLCAARFLERYGKAEDRDKLAIILHDGEQWIAELLQNQVSHPVLAYYRSQHLGQSWLGSLVTFLDMTVLLQSAGDHPLSENVRNSFRMALYALVEMTRVMKLRPQVFAWDRLRDEDYPQLREILEKVGIFLPSQEDAPEKFRELRKLYEPHAAALSHRLRLTLPVWIPPEEAGESSF